MRENGSGVEVFNDTLECNQKAIEAFFQKEEKKTQMLFRSLNHFLIYQK